VADDDAFEAGLVVDDPAFAEEIDLSDDSSSSSNLMKYAMYTAAVAVLLVGAVCIFKKFQAKDTDNVYLQHEYTMK